MARRRTKKKYIKKRLQKKIKKRIQKEQKRRENNDKDFYARAVLSNWYRMLDVFKRGEAYNMLRSAMGALIKENGLFEVAGALQNAALNGNIFVRDIAYNIDLAMSYISNIIDFIPEQGFWYNDTFMDRMETMRILGSQAELYENWETPF